MSPQDLIASLSKLRQLRAQAKGFIPGLRLGEAMLLTIDDFDDRQLIVIERLKIENAVQAFLDPTATYHTVTDATKEIIAACRRISSLALQWDNFDLQLATRRLQDCSDEISKIVFHSDLWDDFKQP